MADKGQTSAQVHDSPKSPTTSVQEVGEAQTSNPPITTNNPPVLPSQIKVSHLFSSPVLLAPSSPCHDIHYKLKRSTTPLASIENPVSSYLSSENHHFFQGLLPLLPRLKSFYDQVLPLKVIFFRNSYLGLDSIYPISEPSIALAVRVERQTVLIIMKEIIYDVFKVTGDVKSARVRITW